MTPRTTSRTSLALLLAVVLSAGSCAPRETAAPPASSDGPALVVLMAVDQLRSDLLERYDHLFTGGLRRLLDTGMVFRNATHDHAETTTAPGHTTLSSGVYPRRHGIVSNTWWELRGGEWQSVYAVSDPESPILGYDQMPGRSPANMYRGGLPDWIAERDPEARVVSLSRKDRAAIGLAGRAEGQVYWLSPSAGRFITSTWYGDEYPEWVERFNDDVMPGIYGQTVWESTIPTEALSLTRPDTSVYEGDGENTFFPHRAASQVDASDPAELNEWRYEDTPFPDEAVLALAAASVRELALGQRGSVDYLGVALSQTDLVGHHYGPLSREQLDNLLRLDRGLEGFFEFLDDTLGPEGWVLGFSSDHGVLDVPEHLAEDGVDARRLEFAEVRALRDMVLAAAEGLDGPAREEAVRDALVEVPRVAAAYTFSEIEAVDAAVEPDSFKVFFSRSHDRERAVEYPGRFGVHFRYVPNTLSAGADPATHGSPYYYDRQVPLIFMGSNVPAGASDNRASTVDLAPTLARLAGIEAPGDLDGRVLGEAIR